MKSTFISGIARSAQQAVILVFIGILSFSTSCFALETGTFPTVDATINNNGDQLQKSTLEKLLSIEEKIENMKSELSDKKSGQSLLASICPSHKSNDSYRIRELEIKVSQIRNIHNEVMFLDDSKEINKLSNKADKILRAAEGICQSQTPSNEKLLTYGSY